MQSSLEGADSFAAHSKWVAFAEAEDGDDLEAVLEEEHHLSSNATLERVFDRIMLPKDPIAPKPTFLEPEWLLQFKAISMEAAWTKCVAREDFIIHKNRSQDHITPPCLDGGMGKCTQCGRVLVGGFVIDGPLIKKQAAMLLAGKPNNKNCFLALKPKSS